MIMHRLVVSSDRQAFVFQAFYEIRLVCGHLPLPGSPVAGHLRGAVNIPLGEIRQRISEIPRDRPVYVHCRTGQRSYNAIMALKGYGFENLINVSGSFLGVSYYEYFDDIRLNRDRILTEYNFQ